MGREERERSQQQHTDGVGSDDCDRLAPQRRRALRFVETTRAVELEPDRHHGDQQPDVRLELRDAERGG